MKTRRDSTNPTNPTMSNGKQMTIEQIRTHLLADGQLWRRGGRDRFFYKMQDNELLCRVNELGGWHPSTDSIQRLTRDVLHVATEDYDYFNNELIKTPLPDVSMSLATPYQGCTGSALALAKQFHDTYERLAPSFGYETRPETREFNPDSPNGRLMIAVCKEIIDTKEDNDDE